MGWTDCIKHGGNTTTITTPAIRDAIENETAIAVSQLCFLYIRVTDKTPYARYVFDKPFLDQLGIAENEKYTILIEDGYEDERGNLLFASTASTCKACLEDFCEQICFKWEMSTQGENI